MGTDAHHPFEMDVWAVLTNVGKGLQGFLRSYTRLCLFVGRVDLQQTVHCGVTVCQTALKCICKFNRVKRLKKERVSFDECVEFVALQVPDVVPL
jgi:hypothetical protein